MGFGDWASNLLDTAATLYGDFVGRTALQVCQLQTADTELGSALVTDFGELLTLIAVEGRKYQQTGEEWEAATAKLTSGLASGLGNAAHAVQIVMSCDPAGARRAVRRSLSATRDAAAALGCDIAPVLDDWAARVARYTAEESVVIAVWTTREALTPAERKRAGTDRLRAMRHTPHGIEAQNVAAPIAALRDAHQTFVSQLQAACEASGVLTHILDSHTAVHELRAMIEPKRTDPDWRALLPGDPLPIREPAPGASDASWWMYPPVKLQLFDRDLIEHSDTVVEVGGMLHHPVMMSLPPQAPQSFNALFRRLIQRPMAWRVSFLLEGDGLRGLTLRSALSSILNWASSDNKMLNQAVKDARAAHLSGEALIRYRVMADTWVSADASHAERKLQDDADALIAAMQGWGQASATDVIGDPTLGVCCTLPGLVRTAPSVPACAPLADALAMAPFTRPASVWPSGPIPLRTPDGKLTPYQPGSSKQSAWVDVVVAPMGRGKSVWMNTLSLGFLLQPGLKEWPYLSVVDVGPSSSGLIDLLRSALAPDRRYLALYRRLRMVPEHSINPFDTELGCTTPLPAHKSFLVNFMSVLASTVDADGRSSTYEGVTGLCSMCIDAAYAEYAPGANPKLYSHSVNKLVAEWVDKLGIPYEDGRTTWWQIVRALCERGGERARPAASVAQRYAVPLLAEVAGLANRQDIQALYTHRVGGEEKITNYVARTCGVEAVRAYPILGRETQFELGQARVVSLDLDEVVVRAAGPAAAKQNAVVYMLARQVTAARFFVSPEDVAQMPEWIQGYQKERIETLRALPKRLCFDEWHRVSAQPGVNREVESLGRESRKWNLHLVLTSQNIGDFAKTLIELSTSRWILGYGTARGIDDMREALGLEPGAVAAVRGLPPKPSAAGATLVEVLVTDEGEIVQTVTNTLGSQILWALSTTSEDVVLRRRLYELLGTAAALRTLAGSFPGGSAKAEIERRRTAVQGRDVIAEIVEELMQRSLAA